MLKNIADSLESVVGAIHRLGTADAATPMGAIELLSLELKEGSKRLSDAVDTSTGLEHIATALENIAIAITYLANRIGK